MLEYISKSWQALRSYIGLFLINAFSLHFSGLDYSSFKYIDPRTELHQKIPPFTFQKNFLSYFHLVYSTIHFSFWNKHVSANWKLSDNADSFYLRFYYIDLCQTYGHFLCVTSSGRLNMSFQCRFWLDRLDMGVLRSKNIQRPNILTYVRLFYPLNPSTLLVDNR